METFDFGNGPVPEWHCGTSHCVAGWCQVLTGHDRGKSAYEGGIRNLPLMAPYFFESNVAIEKLKEIANV